MLDRCQTIRNIAIFCEMGYEEALSMILEHLRTIASYSDRRDQAAAVDELLEFYEVRFTGRTAIERMLGECKNELIQSALMTAEKKVRPG